MNEEEVQERADERTQVSTPLFPDAMKNLSSVGEGREYQGQRDSREDADAPE